MKHLLVLTTLDVRGRRNNREHHVIRELSRRFDRVTVVYRQRGAAGRRLGALIGSGRTQGSEDGVRYIGVDPPLNPPEGTVRALTRQEGRAGGMRRGLGLVLDTIAIARDEVSLRSLGHAARKALRPGETTICEAFGPWAVRAALPLRRDGRIAALVYVDRDYEPGFVTSPLRRGWAARHERSAAAKADLTLSIGRRLAARLNGIPGARVDLSPTGVDSAFFAGRPREEPRPRLIFVGRVAPWSGIEEALDALALLRPDHPDARLEIFGPVESLYRDRLAARVGELGLASAVDWRGDRPREEVAAALAEAGIGLATFRPHPLRLHAAPLKVLEYMASALPVIALEGSEAGDLVERSGAGLTTACSGAGIAAAVRRLIGEPQLYRDCARAGPATARAHDWGRILAREFELISTLLDSDPVPDRERVAT
ncbi:glycosyltransferase family 4 protein [Acidimangrovimonas pyrenivorans]|uniref:Glycosyltransferase family 4 protein n=1 Tax=Acidimangrovimonas pyrenivorans TaxID=2030798 RepID=A0ABV7AFZ9_9RHOB